MLLVWLGSHVLSHTKQLVLSFLGNEQQRFGETRLEISFAVTIMHTSCR